MLDVINDGRNLIEVDFQPLHKNVHQCAVSERALRFLQMTLHLVEDRTCRSALGHPTVETAQRRLTQIQH